MFGPHHVDSGFAEDLAAALEGGECTSARAERAVRAAQALALLTPTVTASDEHLDETRDAMLAAFEAAGRAPATHLGVA